MSAFVGLHCEWCCNCCSVKKNEDRLHELVTEKAFPVSILELLSTSRKIIVNDFFIVNYSSTSRLTENSRGFLAVRLCAVSR